MDAVELAKSVQFQSCLSCITKRIIFFVKAGENFNVAHVHDLRRVLRREKAEIGVLISMGPPTKLVLKESSAAGFYKSLHLDDSFLRMQLFTIEELLQGK
jgi:hypothetical protein